MAYTRAQLVTLMEEAMDAVGSDRWGTTLKRQVLTTVHARGWRRLLNAHRTLRWAKRTVTLDSDGRCALSDLDGGSGDAAERFYKVLAAATASGHLRYDTTAEFMDDPLATTRTPTQLAWQVWRQGDSLQFLPATSGESVEVWVNHLPAAISDLASDSSTVVWPRDYEPILAYEAGAILLAKGGAEVDGTQTLAALAENLWADLLADVSRFSTDPKFLRASDTPGEWGSL